MTEPTNGNLCCKSSPPTWKRSTGCVRLSNHRDHPLLFERLTGRPVKLAKEQHVTDDGRVWPYGKVNREYA